MCLGVCLCLGQAAKKIKNRMQQLGGMFERRDMEKLSGHDMPRPYAHLVFCLYARLDLGLVRSNPDQNRALWHSFFDVFLSISDAAALSCPSTLAEEYPIICHGHHVSKQWCRRYSRDQKATVVHDLSSEIWARLKIGYPQTHNFPDQSANVLRIPLASSMNGVLSKSSHYDQN